MMTDNAPGTAEGRDERTPLLRDEPPALYEAIVTGRAIDGSEEDGRGSERDPLLKPAPPGAEEEGDVEAHGGESEGEGEEGEGGDGDDEERPSFLIYTHPRRFRVVFAGIMLTYFIANFDSTIMASSHPVITSHFQASNMASWLTTAFLLTATAFQPLMGRLSDTVGRKPL
ncbi:hypothetical protein EKO27_g11656, partial [Xylaria grammica]